MIRVKKPTCLDDLEVLVEGILRTGKPAVINLPVTNREDAILRALALLGIRFGRDEPMLEAIIGSTELTEGTCIIKNIVTGEQKTILQQELVTQLF